MILIDPPVWPAHGTHFGHLVSDASLAQLHAFARRTGLPQRAFDHDHYDVPASRYDELVAAGAVPVSSADLVRRLVASGLRVRPAEKTPNRRVARARLHAAWDRLLPDHSWLRDELLERWSEPHRRYHDVRHLASCLAALDELGADDPLVALAAWFHDAVYDGVAGSDEEASAACASALLDGVLPAGEVAEVARLVLLTATHDPESGDFRGAWLSDADLSVLGALPGRYHVYVRDVRAEYGHLDDATFAAGRARVLGRLLDLDPLYRTPRGVRLWGDVARRNLADELETLR